MDLLYKIGGIGERVGNKALNAGESLLTLPLNMISGFSGLANNVAGFVGSPFGGVTTIALICVGGYVFVNVVSNKSLPFK